MESKEYRTIDRKAQGWPAGEWDGEPDKCQWEDGKTGLPCLAVRNRHSGHWCGYVGVPVGHKHYGHDWEDAGELDVHGGITFGDTCQPVESEAFGICHVPGEGEPDNVWWLGFDCAHAWDYSPRDAMMAETRGYPFTIAPDATYRTLAYVKKECRRLAAQLAEC